MCYKVSKWRRETISAHHFIFTPELFVARTTFAWIIIRLSFWSSFLFYPSAIAAGSSSWSISVVWPIYNPPPLSFCPQYPLLSFCSWSKHGYIKTTKSFRRWSYVLCLLVLFKLQTQEVFIARKWHKDDIVYLKFREDAVFADCPGEFMRSFPEGEVTYQRKVFSNWEKKHNSWGLELFCLLLWFIFLCESQWNFN